MFRKYILINLRRLWGAIALYFSILFRPEAAARKVRIGSFKSFLTSANFFFYMCIASGALWAFFSYYLKVSSFYLSFVSISNDADKWLYSGSLAVALVVLGLVAFASLRFLFKKSLTGAEFFHCFAYPAGAALLLMAFLFIGLSAYIVLSPEAPARQITSLNRLLEANNLPSYCSTAGTLECRAWTINSSTGGLLTYLTWGIVGVAFVLFLNSTSSYLRIHKAIGAPATALSVTVAAAALAGIGQGRDHVLAYFSPADVHYDRGSRSLNAGRVADAISHLQLAIQSAEAAEKKGQPDLDRQWRAHNLLGIAHLVDKAYDPAIAEFGMAIQLLDLERQKDTRVPDDERLPFNRGFARYLNYQFSAAIADFDDALAINRDFRLAIYARCAAQAAVEHVEDALQSLSSVVTFRKPATPPKGEAVKLIEANLIETSSTNEPAGPGRLDRQEPIVQLDECRRNMDWRGDEQLNQVFLNGLKHVAAKDYEQAIKSFTAVIGRDKGFALAYKQRAEAYRAIGDMQNVIADYTDTIRLAPNYVQAYLGRASALVYARDHLGAITDYTQAIQRGHDEALVYVARGRAYIERQQWIEALTDFTTAIEKDGKSFAAYHNRGVVHIKRGVPAEALADFDKAIALKPDFADAHYGRGDVLRQLGDNANAIASFRKALELDPRHNEAANALKALGAG